jgi:hypothetical protein
MAKGHDIRVVFIRFLLIQRIRLRADMVLRTNLLRLLLGVHNGALKPSATPENCDGTISPRCERRQRFESAQGTNRFTVF